MLGMLVCSAYSAMAQNKFHIEPVTVESYDEVTVPVLLDLEDAAAQAFQLDVKLPAELEFTKNPVKVGDRLTPGHTVSFNRNNGRIIVTSSNLKTIAGSEGAVLNLFVKAKEGMLEDKKGRINIENVTLTKAGASLLDPSVKIDVTAEGADVNMHASKAWTYFTETALPINPDGTATVDVAISNDFDVRGFQFNITLPEGFTISEDVKTSDRCSDELSLMQVVKGNDVIFTATTFNTLPVIFDNDGVVFTLTVPAPADFTAETAEITIHSATFSTDNATTVEAMSSHATSTLTFANGGPAYTRAMAEITALETELTEALATIAEEAAGVKDDFTGENITAEIAKLKEAVEAAYNDFTLTGNYNEVMAPAADIKAAIAKLVEDAKAAQKALNDLNKAAENAVLAIESLEEKWTAAINTINTEAPDVAEDFDIYSVYKKISALRQEVEKAYEDGSLVENYDELMAPAAGIEAEIEKMIEDAKAAQLAFEIEKARKEANEAAHAADIETIDALITKLEETLAEIKEGYPDFDASEIEAEIREAIEAERSKAVAALEQVKEEGVYSNEVDTESINDKISNIFDQAGIDFITVDSLRGDEKFYDLSGRKLSRAAQGVINIIVGKDGSVQKVLIK